MTFWEIILYSLVQGLTEFLPISSSGHLLILENILEWPIPGRTMAIAAHLGSLFAVILYLKKDMISFFTKDIKKHNNIILIRNLIIITLPIVIIGFFIFKIFDNKLLTLNTIAWSSILGACLLYLSDKSKSTNKDIYSLSVLESIFIGIIQIFALIPGASRAGTIITASRFLNVDRIQATKLGLYSGLPTITGAVLLEIIWLLNNQINYEIYYIGIISILSFIFAYLSILLLMKWLKSKSFMPFIIYRISLGIIILYIINN